MAQDPPGTLPSAFQERFCLSERHVRCEMFKLAQTSRSAALADEGVPVEQVRGARFKPAVRSVPLALGASRGAAGSRSSGRSRRPVILAAAGTGGIAVVLIAVLALVGGGGPGGGALASASPSVPPTSEATATARLTLPPAATPSLVPAFSPEASPTAVSRARIINYEVQEGEGLIRIAETFGVTRRRILNANEGMRDQDPYVVPGDIIRVPVASAVTEDEITAQPGFVEFIE